MITQEKMVVAVARVHRPLSREQQLPVAVAVAVVLTFLGVVQEVVAAEVALVGVRPVEQTLVAVV
jgi:hypothetical protein